MNNRQKQLLNIMQEGIPLCKRPYQALGNILHMSEQEVYDAYMDLYDKGLIRRYGGIVDINKLGVVSTLVGVQVSPEQINHVATYVSSYEGVTHNYERNDTYNLWFTLMASSQEEIDNILGDLSEKIGVIDVINLPSKQKFKTKVVFKF